MKTSHGDPDDPNRSFWSCRKAGGKAANPGTNQNNICPNAAIPYYKVGGCGGDAFSPRGYYGDKFTVKKCSGQGAVPPSSQSGSSSSCIPRSQCPAGSYCPGSSGPITACPSGSILALTLNVTQSLLTVSLMPPLLFHPASLSQGNSHRRAPPTALLGPSARLEATVQEARGRSWRVHQAQSSHRVSP